MHLQAVDHWLNGEVELHLVGKLCRRGCVAIDAGANIGSYSYQLRKYATRVMAYEPNPQLAQRLARLMPDIQVRNVALSDRACELVLRVPVDADGTAHHEQASVSQAFDGKTAEFRVQGITIDSENLENVGFIKIDVEQHERQVLLGALATIRRCRPVILIEVYPLKYERSLIEEFGHITAMTYSGWFMYQGRWLPLSQLKTNEHVVPANFGKANAFIGNNLIFYPNEHVDSQVGPQR